MGHDKALEVNSPHRAHERPVRRGGGVHRTGRGTEGRPALSGADGAGPAYWRMRSRIQTPASFRTPVPAQVEPLQVPVLKTAPERWSSE